MTNRGLLSQIDPRAAGIALLGQALNPNPGQALAQALATGRESFLQEEDRKRAQAYQDALFSERQQTAEAQREAYSALADKRRAEIEAARKDAQAKIDASAKTEQGIAGMRAELVGMGIAGASLADAKTVKKLYSEVLDRHLSAAMPAPPQTLTPWQQAQVHHWNALDTGKAKAGKPESPGKQAVDIIDPVAAKWYVDSLLDSRPDLQKAILAARAQHIPDAKVLSTLREKGLL